MISSSPKSNLVWTKGAIAFKKLLILVFDYYIEMYKS
jgi:hypothetical protein